MTRMNRITSFMLAFCVVIAAGNGSHAQSIDETYQRALKEGGALNIYGTLTPDTAAKVLPLLFSVAVRFSYVTSEAGTPLLGVVPWHDQQFSERTC